MKVNLVIGGLKRREFDQQINKIVGYLILHFGREEYDE